MKRYIPQYAKDAMVKAYAQGQTASELARKYEVNVTSVLAWVRKAGIPVRRAGHPRDPDLDARAKKMAEMYRQGVTLAKIGAQFGITRERVRQLIGRHGLNGKSGGAHRSAVVKRDRTEKARAAACIQRWGVDTETLRLLRKNGATRAYQYQKRSAKTRGISWNLSLADWWAIWRDSGKWEQRGKSADAYVMSRICDSGGYEMGNVHVQTLRENSREAVKLWAGKKKTLPRGVFDLYPGRSRRYSAVWRKRRLGYFETVGEAATARLRCANQERIFFALAVISTCGDDCGNHDRMVRLSEQAAQGNLSQTSPLSATL